MVLTETTGSTTPIDTSENTIVDQSGLNNYAARIDLSNMLTSTGDTVRIRYYAKVNGSLRLEQSFTYTGTQAVPSIFIPWVPASEFKVTLTQTAGTNRTYNWSWYNL